jgi:Tol biopolymer transport system component
MGSNGQRPRRSAVVRRSAIIMAAAGLLALNAMSVPTAGAAGSATTQRVSVATGGAQGNNMSGWRGAPVTSADGRWVAFDSLASNLVAGDTNAIDDVFVRDRTTGTTERVSVSTSGAQGNAISNAPAISADGRFVAFESSATNLVRGDTNGASDIFVRDRQARTTERISVATNGAQANGASHQAAISADGRFVAFASDASNLVPSDTNNTTDIFVRDRQTHTTERVSVSSNGIEGTGFSADPSLSADGRFVAFTVSGPAGPRPTGGARAAAYGAGSSLAPRSAPTDDSSPSIRPRPTW